MQSLTPASIRALLDAHGCRPSRALGQHFLADPNLADKIVRLAEVAPGDPVLEIGPGLGSLTVALCDAGAEVVALELDRHLVPVLAGVVGDRVRIVEGDALSVDLTQILDERTWTCVSNLPYNVATPVVVRILEEFPRVSRCLVMVQREVGERLVAGPGTKAYGAVSVKVAYHARARLVGTVAASVFVPPPKVESALVRLDRHPTPPVDVPSVSALFRLVRAGFAQRRKTLRRSLAPVLGDRADEVLVAAGIAPSDRAEVLDLDAWARLCREAA